MNLKERLLSSINRHGFEKLRVASTRECNRATLNPHLATNYATSQQLEDSPPLRRADSDTTLDATLVATSMQRLRMFMQLGLDKAYAIWVALVPRRLNAPQFEALICLP